MFGRGFNNRGRGLLPPWGPKPYTNHAAVRLLEDPHVRREEACIRSPKLSRF